MIGVQCSQAEIPSAREFFELFKTPWERCQAGVRYDAVLSTVGDAPPPGVRVLLVFRSAAHPVDELLCLGGASKSEGATLEAEGKALPIYQGLYTFEGHSRAGLLAADGEKAAGFWRETGNRIDIRLGYNLFEEVRHLIADGQPVRNARIPTLDIHVDLVRRWLVRAGIQVIEIPPAPAGHSFAVCLTHDIDFIGIRQHFLDATMWGFLYRATAGAGLRFLRGRLGIGRLLACWGRALSLPLVYVGLMKDFWEPFGWMLRVERGLPTTYFVIPFKQKPGEHVAAANPQRRGTAYDIRDLSAWIPRLQGAGAEIGVHGIDAWHSLECAKAERARIGAHVAKPATGIRMHWLLRETATPQTLEQAGYDYDSTFGYNETPGYRAGTGQVHGHVATNSLLELPLHIQDGALFYPQRLDLTETSAWSLCQAFIQHAETHGGVITVLWHDRSHGPERYWGEFYVRLVEELKSRAPWFGTGAEVVSWYRSRRAVEFRRTADGSIVASGVASPGHPFRMRVHPPSSDDRGFHDTPWDGKSEISLSAWSGAKIASAPDAMHSSAPN